MKAINILVVVDKRFLWSILRGKTLPGAVNGEAAVNPSELSNLLQTISNFTLMEDDLLLFNDANQILTAKDVTSAILFRNLSRDRSPSGYQTGTVGLTNTVLHTINEERFNTQSTSSKEAAACNVRKYMRKCI